MTDPKHELETCYLHTPIGWLSVAADVEAIVSINFIDEPPKGFRPVTFPHLRDAYRQLMQYFQGERLVFNLPLKPAGTEFQRKVWQGLREIPYGQTQSYSELARRIGCPEGARAVGMANHHNPLPVLIPCHRVIGANGSLTGYAGGTDIKRRLLELEGCMP